SGRGTPRTGAGGRELAPAGAPRRSGGKAVSRPDRDAGASAAGGTRRSREAGYRGRGSPASRRPRRSPPYTRQAAPRSALAEAVQLGRVVVQHAAGDDRGIRVAVQRGGERQPAVAGAEVEPVRDPPGVRAIEDFGRRRQPQQL